MSTAAPTLRRAGLAMAAGTVASRVTGLVRTAALAAALGVTVTADAYNIANTIPTILLVLVTGGTLSAVLVPLIARAPDAERAQVASSLGTLVLWATGAAAVLAALGSPLLGRLFALGLRGDPAYDDFVRLSTVLLVLFAPQVLAYGVSVHAVAVLNAHGRLALGAFASVLTNVVTIAAIAGYVVLREGDGPPDSGAALYVLGAGTTLGVVAMAAVQYWGARRLVPGLRLLALPRRDETSRQVLRLGRWTVVYVVANQVGLAVVLTVAAGSQAASAYQWAFAVMQLPFAVVAVSVLSALYPALTRAAVRSGVDLGRELSRGLRVLVLLLAPAAVLLLVAAGPVTQVLLGYGAVGSDDVDLIATAVRGFAVALVPFTIFQLLTRSCYALSDARTPALVNLAVNAVNVVGAGLAAALTTSTQQLLALLVLAYAASYAVGCALLVRHLHGVAEGAFSGLPGLWWRMGMALLASGAVAVVVSRATDDLVGGAVAGAALQLLLVVPATLAVYAVLVLRLVPGARTLLVRAA